MAWKFLTQVIFPRSPKVPLRGVLIVPFFLQTLILVGVTGWLSLKQGQKSIDNLAIGLQEELLVRVQQHLNRYLETAELANETTINGLDIQGLETPNIQQLQSYLFRQLQSLKTVNTIGLGFPNGNYQYVGVGRYPQQKYVFKVSPRNPNDKNNPFYVYELNAEGKIKKLLETRNNYILEKRAWYEASVKSAIPQWSQPYIMYSHQKPGLTVTQGIFKQNKQLVAVIGTDVLISEMSRFLQGLTAQDQGQFFIVNPQGYLLADSSVTVDFSELILAKNSGNPLLASVIKNVNYSWGNLFQITQERKLKIRDNNQFYYVSVTPLKSDQTVDWILISTIPESRFVNKLQYYTQVTLILCILSVIVSGGLCVIIANAIVKPIDRLNYSVTALAKGKWSPTNPYIFYQSKEETCKEIYQLKCAFEQMREQLKESFVALELSKNELEGRVEERTHALSSINEELYREIQEREKVEEALREMQGKVKRQNNILFNLATDKSLYEGDLSAIKQFTEATANTLNVDRASIWLYNEDRTMLECIDLFDRSKQEHRKTLQLSVTDYPIYFTILAQNRYIFTSNAEEDQRLQELLTNYLSSRQITSLLNAPIRLTGDLVGVVSLEEVNQEREWTIEDQNFAGSIADLISLVIEAKRTQETKFALEKSEQMYRDLVETANCIILQLTPDGIVTFINENGADFFQYSQKSLISYPIIGRLIEDSPKKIKEIHLLLSAMRKNPEQFLNYELEHIRSNGEKVWVSWANKPLFNSEGKLSEILSVGTDCTARRQAEEQLREKQQYLRLILDNIPQQVFWKDRNLVFQGCNKNWAESAFLSSPEEVIGKTDYDLLPTKEAADFFRSLDQKIMDDDKPQLHFIAKKQRPDAEGKTIWLDINKIPIHNGEGEVIGILGVLEDITQRKLAEEALQAEQEKSESLLLNILPSAIADQLKENQSQLIAEHFEQATILFADIVGFTPLSAKMQPIELVQFLNKIFSKFDQLVDRYELEKIKTIGDAYMVVGGLPVLKENHAQLIAQLALDMQSSMEAFARESGEPLQIRIGINTGPVVAGVIGIRKFIYDLWGDTVNVSSRMESQGEPGGIQVTENTYEVLKDQFIFRERGTMMVKGKGEMITYWLIDRIS